MAGGLGALLSPVILFFALGAAAAFARSDLSVPEAVAKGMSLYLMAAIGLKGGVQVAESGFTADMLAAAAVGVALSSLLPLPAFAALRRFGGLDPLNAGAVAAHYGSVSVVTFVAGVELLAAGGLRPAGHMVAVLALMETPAIVVGLLLARRGGDGAAAGGAKAGGDLLHEALLNGSVVLLMGSFAIGLACGKEGVAPIAPVFDTAFRGVLCLFLLDMGLVAARRLRDARALTPRLAALAVLLPIVNGTVGVLAAGLAGLDSASAAALGVLAGSASYIAVPAAMRLALPQADPGLYLAMSLAVTFPFNLAVGIPFYTLLATRLI
ncbi:MAG: putative sodium-dependent bicarbonate transporter [uncultured Sphingomonas sp.]|uniref:Putative sodium-dependent bicarbonate transporter n=1 Tax=uncultured Sphingomonas sp. TaxID=158754 RepID=A0A6J4TGT5_9SPHN|nr:sodium-dependent bicarbonate transport family permease [uncultured Sphingomonas sp.]CAA9522217.1 MAG: putative sodium-dependent bicarbonate transporter [uncultured Sphingomonas sp.]